MAEKERQIEESWKIYNEEEVSKKVEREKRIQRHIRKLELKKEKVVGKLFRHEAQVNQRKIQQQQAIEIKRDLNIQLQE